YLGFCQLILANSLRDPIALIVDDRYVQILRRGKQRWHGNDQHISVLVHGHVATKSASGTKIAMPMSVAQRYAPGVSSANTVTCAGLERPVMASCSVVVGLSPTLNFPPTPTGVLSTGPNGPIMVRPR